MRSKVSAYSCNPPASYSSFSSGTSRCQAPDISHSTVGRFAQPIHASVPAGFPVICCVELHEATTTLCLIVSMNCGNTCPSSLTIFSNTRNSGFLLSFRRARKIAFSILSCNCVTFISTSTSFSPIVARDSGIINRFFTTSTTSSISFTKEAISSKDFNVII